MSNPIIDTTESPFAPDTFADVAGRSVEYYTVRNDYISQPGLIGFQMQDRPSPGTLRVFVNDSTFDDVALTGTELTVVTSGIPNDSQVLVALLTGWCMTGVGNVGLSFACVYDSRGSNESVPNIRRIVSEEVGTAITDGLNTLVPPLVTSEVAAQIAPFDARITALETQARIVTDWAAYTPGLLQGFGVATGISFWWRRIGDVIQIAGELTNGTVTADELRLGLPVNADTGMGDVLVHPLKIASSTYGAGLVWRTASNAGESGGPRIVVTPGAAYLQFSRSPAYLSPDSGSGMFPNNDRITLRAEFPVDGW